MRDSAWEVVMEAAAEVESLVEECDDDRQCRTRDALDTFDCCPADHLPARAVTALVDAWLSTLDADDKEGEFWALGDEDADAAASSSTRDLGNA